MSWLDWLFGESTDKKMFDYINSVDKVLTERISYIDKNNISIIKDLNERIVNLEINMKHLLSKCIDARIKNESRPAKIKQQKVRDRPKKSKNERQI